MIGEDLNYIATGRRKSLFSDDIHDLNQELLEAITGKRILIIGAAGTIGASTLREIVQRKPAALHIVDQNENGLAELTRQLRANFSSALLNGFQALPIDYDTAAMRFFLQAQKPYHAILNFAALKHVRSEKDPYSTLQMLETNLIKQIRLMETLAETKFEGRFFSVSTDKAANPSSMMGASKRVMEHVLFNSSQAASLSGIKSSTRFANVAYSNGSLPQSYFFRLQRGEPLVAPQETKRYFVSIEEAGEICAIAAFLAPSNSIVVPKLKPEEHLVPLQDVAEGFLHQNGFKPVVYTDERAAIEAVKIERSRGCWPLLITPLDTAGEKPYEEFVANGETLEDIGLKSLQAVNYLPRSRQKIDAAIGQLSALLSVSSSKLDLTKEHLKEIIGIVEPDFLTTHRDAIKNLDQRL